MDINIGDIVQIWPHRLLCGDSTNDEDVQKLMKWDKASLASNDPPYGMKKKMKNDKLDSDKLLEFNKKWIDNQLSILHDNWSWYCWGKDEGLMEIYSHLLKPKIRDNRMTYRNLITWDKWSWKWMKSNTHRMYPTADEKCLFMMMGVQWFNTNSDNYFEWWEPIRMYLKWEMDKCGGSKNWRIALGNHMWKHYFTKSQWAFPTKATYKRLQEFWSKDWAFTREYWAFTREYEDLKREYYNTRSYFDNEHDNMNSVWHFSRTLWKEREETWNHETPKPIDVCKRIIKSSSRENDVVVDFFLGSWSTMVACHQTNRICYGIEIEPKYCQMIINRMQNLDRNLSIYKL